MTGEFTFDEQITFMGGREIAAAAGDDDDNGARARRNDQLPPLNWKKLGSKVCGCFRRTPKLDFM